jgi:hypothetical protein
MSDNLESIVCPNTDENLRHSEGAAIDLCDGSLLLAWTRFRGGSPLLSEARERATLQG